MKTLRDSKVLAVLGVLAVAVMVSLVAAPTAEAGGYGHGYHYGSYHTPVHTHYVAPVYPSYNYYPAHYSTYYTPTYIGHGCHYGW